MVAVIYKCETCNTEFAREVLAGDCEWKHEKDKIKDDVVRRHGNPVWNCVRAVEAWEGQENWHMLVADELSELLKTKADQSGESHGERG